MSRGDGKNPKFRILCKRCNSYQHIFFKEHLDGKWTVTCRKCLNTANDFEEELE